MSDGGGQPDSDKAQLQRAVREYQAETRELLELVNRATAASDTELEFRGGKV